MLEKQDQFLWSEELFRRYQVSMSPHISFNIVDLPHPDGPIIPRVSPALTVKLIPSEHGVLKAFDKIFYLDHGSPTATLASGVSDSASHLF